MNKYVKNRNRSEYSFANINLLGKCSANCIFCLGNDLKEEFAKYNYNTVHFSGFPNIEAFLCKCKYLGIKQLYITGQNTDPLCYRYLGELIDWLKSFGFYVGLRTNGIGAVEKIDIINKATTCSGDAVSYTVLSFKKEICEKLGVPKLPDWETIFTLTKPPRRASIVVTDENETEVESICKRLSNFYPKPEYIQIRRVSTDYHINEMIAHQEAYDRIKSTMLIKYGIWGHYEKALITNINEVDIVFWETVATTTNSINYFVNGVISMNYFIIEGYEKNKWQIPYETG